MLFQSFGLCLEGTEVLFKLSYGLFPRQETPVSETSPAAALLVTHAVRGVVCVMSATAFTCVVHFVPPNILAFTNIFILAPTALPVKSVEGLLEPFRVVPDWRTTSCYIINKYSLIYLILDIGEEA
jgi:hypothetical protein